MLHPVTWLVWLTAALISALSTRNPLYLAIIVLTAATVRAAWRGQSPAALAWGTIVRLGLMLWGVTAVFDAFTAHHGATVLFALPSTWPLIGGPITLESLLYGLISGLALTTLLITFATFNSTVNHHRLLRFIPNFLRQAGLIVSIALVFVPQMMAALKDIRQAQRLRGHRFRGIRDLLPLMVPLLGNALERAIGLAEAMEARGFASPAPSERNWLIAARRLILLLCVLSVISGLFVTRYWPQHAIAGWTMMTSGTIVFFAVLWNAGSARKRTQYRRLKLDRRDALVMVTAGGITAVVSGLMLIQSGSLTYSPYPEAVLPAFNPLIGAVFLLLTVPALVPNEGADKRRSNSAQQRKSKRLDELPPVDGAIGTSPSHSPTRAPLHGRQVIELKDVSYHYPETDLPALDQVTLSIAAGEFVLVMGPSGAGKSTFLRALNGLVPHFTGGAISGEIRVADRDPITRGTEGMADAVGFVFQDPEAQFVADRVEDELVFALENLGYPRQEIDRRLNWVLDLLNLHHLRYRRVDTLSGGERQRVAIGSVLALRPQILVLDEPTSQLDPAGADELLMAVTELNQQIGLTVVLAEHRLERVLPYADKVVYFPGLEHAPVVGRPRDILQQVDLVPPVVNLAKAVGWEPLPLTVEEAESFVGNGVSEEELRATAQKLNGAKETVWGLGDGVTARPKVPFDNLPRSAVALRVSDLWCGYENGDRPVLRDVDLIVEQGEVVAVMGLNGAGKTTLLRCVMGLVQPQKGGIEVLGRDARALSTAELASFIGFVPQNAGATLFTDSVKEEIAFTRHSQGLPPDGHDVLKTFGLLPLLEHYPWDLSVGERQRVAIAAFLAGEPELLLLDEPTRGLDYGHKETLTATVRQHQAAGHAVILVTHDVELVASVADRMIILEDGKVAADGSTEVVMRDHPAFASQISRLLRDNGTASMTVAQHQHPQPGDIEKMEIEG